MRMASALEMASTFTSQEIYDAHGRANEWGGGAGGGRRGGGSGGGEGGRVWGGDMLNRWGVVRKGVDIEPDMVL